MSKFFDALRAFEGAYASIGAFVGRPQAIDGPTDLERQNYCLDMFNDLKNVWPKDVELLNKLEYLLHDCVAAYNGGNIDQGDDIVMKLDEIIWAIRHGKL